ncbi:YitT family protein [Aquibacillus saliphilus]|uniref:YitT family protein n=1 Tax=Aquibacillus saliphilus TaxID=1909422 RepID=UPI001CEFEA13|nr:YitT family protein [Aquibacillus saliphilus]
MFLIKKISTIILGSILLSIGINFFLVPFKLLDGGMIGLGLIVNYLTGIQAGLAIIGLSIPIFILAWVYHRDYFYNSLHGMLLSAFMIDYLSKLHYSLIAKFHFSSILSAVLGGIFIGIGIGIMLRYKTSTGGTDLLAQFLSRIYKVNIGITIFILDSLIICLGGLLISFKAFILSTVTIIFVGIFTSLCTWNMEQDPVQ